MRTLGVISMSGDPITKGHLWMVDEALRIYTDVDIMLADNADKKYLFTLDERQELVSSALDEYFHDQPEKIDRVRIRIQHESEFIALDLQKRYADGYDMVSFVRGLRNGIDMAYEQDMININRLVCPDLSTIYLIPPLHIQGVSSSMVKKLYKLQSWRSIADQYVTPFVAASLRARIYC